MSPMGFYIDLLEQWDTYRMTFKEKSSSFFFFSVAEMALSDRNTWMSCLNIHIRPKHLFKWV